MSWKADSWGMDIGSVPLDQHHTEKEDRAGGENVGKKHDCGSHGEEW